MNASAIAGVPPVPASPVQAVTDVVKVATKAELELLRKKKAAAAAKTKSKTAAKGTVATDKKAAAAKAKADKAEKEKLAKAKADQDKLAAAKAAEKKKFEAAAKIKAAEKLKLAAKAKAEKDKQLTLAWPSGREQLAAKAKADEIKRIAKAKADEKRKIARAKEAEERKIARAKADEERRIARAKAAEERKLAQAQAAEQRRLIAEAKLKAAEEKRLARIRAEEERRQQIAAAAEAARQAEISRLVAMEVVQTGNNAELRSEKQEAPKPVGLFAGLFGGSIIQKQSMLPETRALSDAALELKQQRKKFTVRPEFEPQVVRFSGYPRGTIVIDTAAHYLYLMEGTNKARRYAIAVGKDGLQYKGAVKVGDKQEWPLDFRPRRCSSAIRKIRPACRRHARRRQDPRRRPALIYLYQGGKDTASAHPRHDRARDDRNRFVQRLLPHDQRARHGSLPARAGRNQRRRPVNSQTTS